MSEPSYRVDFTHRPGERFEWAATVWRLSDDTPVAAKVGETAREAGEDARAWIIAQNVERQERQPLYMDENGNLTGAPREPEPQSLRA